MSNEKKTPEKSKAPNPSAGDVKISDLLGDESNNIRVDRPFYTAKCDDPITGALVGFEWGSVNNTVEVIVDGKRKQETRARDVPHAVFRLMVPAVCDVDGSPESVPAGEEIAFVWGAGLAKLAKQYQIHGPLFFVNFVRAGKIDLDGGKAVTKWTAAAIQPVSATKLPEDVKDKLRELSRQLDASWAGDPRTIRRKAAAAAGQATEEEADGLPF
jgi:hypothetical protein